MPKVLPKIVTQSAYCLSYGWCCIDTIFTFWYFSGEGIPDLLLLLVQWTQKTMVEKLTYSEEVQVSFTVT